MDKRGSLVRSKVQAQAHGTTLRLVGHRYTDLDIINRTVRHFRSNAPPKYSACAVDVMSCCPQTPPPNAKSQCLKQSLSYMAEVDFLLGISLGASILISGPASNKFTPPANHLWTATNPLSIPITTSQSTSPIAMVVAANILFKNLPSCLSFAKGVTTKTTQKKIPGVCFHRDNETRHIFIHNCLKFCALQA